MNKAVSFFMAILALVVMIPTAAFAQESNTSTAKVNEATEKTYDQGIRDVELGGWYDCKGWLLFDRIYELNYAQKWMR